ncbi:ABC-2 type transport system ATP-binding protein [Filimonas lacunae]|uniref:ABC-2 type transport system ATP-binding protein n=1 Tax=Filimonas lacunae TaxID=477680 RepID=A0A173MCW1_9BACT|nr:ATP-binding cassette domain-containing protein [Filimonas lacunae]BAV05291.1 ABC transporter, ATP-binding protein [Filimonas lacunae]SIT22169.1 ABC-2 type transport system ATP-binding protein [Filimonas lacunae]
MLHLKDVKKMYPQQLVIDIPALELHSGLYWIKGANGAGKTTLLKMVAGLIPFEGDIACQGISLKHNPVAYRNLISWAEAEPLYPPFLKGTELVRLYLDIYKTATPQLLTTLTDALDMGAYIHHTIGSYSAGMTKKLSLLLAFLCNTPLVILDEPLITLDAATVTVVSNYILEAQKRSGTLFLMSSHQQLPAHVTLPVKEMIVHHYNLMEV